MDTINHSNRKAYNWLIYDINQRCMVSKCHLYQGVLYDLGSGESPYRDFFLNYANHYVAVDWSGSFHDTKADIIADLNLPLPIGDSIADTVVSLSVLEHLYEPQLMLCEAFRILKSGGSLVLQVPWQWRIHEAPYDFFRYTPFGLEYMLKKAGFEDVVVEPQAGVFTSLILKFNYFSRKAIRGPRIARFLIARTLSVFWFVGQKLAPFLDRLDGDWKLEACGYFVTAKKI